MWRDLRSFIKFLESQNGLIRINKQVDTKFEISWILRKMGKIGMPAALFERVKARDIPVVGNLYSTSKRVCQALGVPKEKTWLECFSTIHETENPVPGLMLSARSNPISHREVQVGPVKEIFKKGSEIDLSKLPVPIWFEHDSGPYISSAVGIAFNQKTEVFNAGVYRIQIVDKDTLAINATPGHDLHSILCEAQRRDEELHIALAIGVPPAVYIAATGCGGTGMPDIPELGVAGYLMGEPIEVIKSESGNLVVPANTEMVIEGKVDFNTKFMEGQITEANGYYTGRLVPLTKVTAMYHRRNPIFHVVLPGHWPGHGAVPAMCKPNPAQILLPLLQNKYPNVHAAAVSSWKSGHLIISLDKKFEGEPAEIIREIFKMSIDMQPLYQLIHRITVVDSPDIDIRDMEEVEWAINNNLQNESRIIVIPNVKSSPVARTNDLDGTSLRLGIDATAPLNAKDPLDHIILYKNDEMHKIRLHESWVPKIIKLKHGKVLEYGDMDLYDYLT